LQQEHCGGTAQDDHIQDAHADLDRSFVVPDEFHGRVPFPFPDCDPKHIFFAAPVGKSLIGP